MTEWISFEDKRPLVGQWVFVAWYTGQQKSPVCWGSNHNGPPKEATHWTPVVVPGEMPQKPLPKLPDGYEWRETPGGRTSITDTDGNTFLIGPEGVYRGVSSPGIRNLDSRGVYEATSGIPLWAIDALREANGL